MQEVPAASLQDIVAFVAVAQTRSFTSAAERLQSNKSAVGRAVQRLETSLGARLLQRTTRAVHLTEDGEIYLATAREVIERLREAQLELASHRTEAVGRVRINLPAGFVALMMPTLGALRARHPGLMLEMSFSDSMADAVGDGWDIVVRIGQLPPDSDMTVRKLCDLTLALYAAPSYLARHAAITSIAELDHHDALLFRNNAGKLRPWTLTEQGLRRDYNPAPSLILGDGNSLIEATIAGLGIAQIIDRFAQPHVAAGRLAPVLPQADAAGPPVHALIPVGHKMTAKIRVVLDHMVATLQNLEVAPPRAAAS